MVRTFDTYEAAAAAKRDGDSLCGTFKTDGIPVYFLAPCGADDFEMRRIGFEVREGRPMSNFERSLLKLAEAGVT